MNYRHINNAVEIFKEGNIGYSNLTGKIFSLKEKLQIIFIDYQLYLICFLKSIYILKLPIVF